MIRRLLLLSALAAASLAAYAQGPPADCSVYGFCAGLGVPTGQCKPGQMYSQIDAPSTFSCTGIPPVWTKISGAGTAANPGGSATQLQYNSAGTSFGGMTGFTYNSSTGLETQGQVANTGGISEQSYVDNVPRMVYDPLDPQYGYGGLANATPGAQQTAVMTAVMQKAECDILLRGNTTGVTSAAEIIIPAYIPLQLNNTLLVYANERLTCSAQPYKGGCEVSHTGYVGPVISTAYGISFTCAGGSVTPNGANAVIDHMTVDGSSSNAGELGIWINDFGAHAYANSLGTHTGFGGPAILQNGTDSHVDDNYMQNANAYYWQLGNQNTTGSAVGALQMSCTDCWESGNEITDGASGSPGNHFLTGTLTGLATASGTTVTVTSGPSVATVPVGSNFIMYLGGVATKFVVAADISATQISLTTAPSGAGTPVQFYAAPNASAYINNAQSLACISVNGGNSHISKDLLQLCNVGIVVSNSSSATGIDAERFDGMAGPAIINYSTTTTTSPRFLYDCLDQINAGCSPFENAAGSNDSQLTGALYGGASGQFGASNIVSLYADNGDGPNTYASNAHLPGQTYSGGNLVTEQFGGGNAQGVAEQSTSSANYNGVTAGIAQPNINDIAVINFTETVPTSVISFHGGVIGHTIIVPGGNSNVTITPVGVTTTGQLQIITCDGQPINLGTITGDLTFKIGVNAITQTGCSQYYFAHLNENGATIASPDFLDVTGNASIRPLSLTGFGAYGVQNPGGSSVCYVETAVIGTGTLVQTTPGCTANTPTNIAPEALEYSIPLQYSLINIYRYSNTVGLTNGLLYSWSTGTAPQPFQVDSAQAPINTTLPAALNVNTTGMLTFNGAELSNFTGTPPIAPSAGGLNVNTGGITYFNGTSWTTISGGGVSGGGTPAIMPVFSGSTAVGNSPVSVVGGGISVAGDVTAVDTSNPAGIAVTPNGVAPAATTGSPMWGVDATVTTAGDYLFPDSPPTSPGVWLGTPSGAVVRNTFLTPSALQSFLGATAYDPYGSATTAQTSAESAAAAALAAAIVTINGTSCTVNGANCAPASGSITTPGATTGYMPLFSTGGSSTAAIGNSPCDYGVTTTGNITCNVATTLGSSSLPTYSWYHPTAVPLIVPTTGVMISVPNTANMVQAHTLILPTGPPPTTGTAYNLIGTGGSGTTLDQVQLSWGAASANPVNSSTTGYLATYASSTNVGGVQYLPAANFPALTGDCTSTAGALATTCAALAHLASANTFTAANTFNYPVASGNAIQLSGTASLNVGANAEIVVAGTFNASGAASFSLPSLPSITVTGNSTALHFAGGGTAPTIAAAAGAGSSPTISLDAYAHDSAFTVTLTPGTSPTTGLQWTVTFNTSYGNSPHCSFDPIGSATTALGLTVNFNRTATTATMNATTALPAGTYTWDVICIK